MGIDRRPPKKRSAGSIEGVDIPTSIPEVDAVAILGDENCRLDRGKSLIDPVGTSGSGVQRVDGAVLASYKHPSA